MKNNNASTFVPLKGPDRVRKRPAVFFGSDDVEGAITAIKHLIDIFIAEAALGFSTEINLTIHRNNSISIHSFDRGMLLDDRIVNNKPLWYYYFCELYYDIRTPNNDYFRSLEDFHAIFPEAIEEPLTKYQTEFAFNLCCVQYASKYMHVETIHNGLRKTLNFKKGYCTSTLKKQKVNEHNGTYIRFLLDTEVFDFVNIPVCAICKTLDETATSIPGIRCKFKDERDNFSFIYYYPSGTEDYISKTTNLCSPLFINEIETFGKDKRNRKEYNAWVRILFAFVYDSPKIECFHNFKSLRYGGQHLKSVKKKIAQYIKLTFSSDFNETLDSDNTIRSREDISLDFDHIANNIVLIIETKCSKHASNYENGTKQSISNQMITDMADNLINQDFGHYLKQNYDSIFLILKQLRERK